MEQANSIEKYLQLLKRYDGYSEKYYRGQLEKHKNIPPSVARNEGYAANEHAIYHEAITMKKEEFVLLDSPLEKLSKLQHYGIPTRLVDVTIDPFYALYFAVEDIDDLSAGNVLVYIAEGHEIDSEHARALSLFATLQTLDLDVIITEYHRLYGVTLSHEQILAYSEKPVFIKHSDGLKKYNERLHSQRGAFLVCGNEVYGSKILPHLKSLDTLEPVMIVRIPYEYKKQVKEELDIKYGINSVAVYPELPSVADYIREKYKKENIALDGKYSVVNTKNISNGFAKRISIVIVLNDILRIDQVRSAVIEVINHYKHNQDVVWVFVAKTGEDYIVSNWILRGQWISPKLDTRYRPLPLKEEDADGYYWEPGASYSTMADYYDKYMFDTDKSLFVCHQKIFEEFIPVYHILLESFERDNIGQFSKAMALYHKQLRRLYMALQDLGRSRDKEFDDFLNGYTSAISPVDDIQNLLNNNNGPERALKYHIGTLFSDAKKYIDIITSKSPAWRNRIGVSDLDYERIGPQDRKRPEYQYIPTLPIRETAIEVYFDVKVVVAENKTFHIQGDTNLFDKASLMLSLRKGNRLLCQGKAEVFNGKFSFPQFSNNGQGFESGQYRAHISLSLPSVQPKEFTTAAGIEYENLTGKYVNRVGIGPTVNYEFDFNID